MMQESFSGVCAMRERLTIENPALVKEWDFEKNGNLRPEDFTGGSNKKVWWTCGLDHSWYAEINKRFTFGRGCPYCSGNKVWVGFNDIPTTHPEIADEWDYDKNGDLRPEQFSAGADVKIWWKCCDGHSWQSLIYSRKNHGCPICAGNVLAVGINDLQTVNPNLAAEWDFEKNGNLRPESVAVNDKRKAWWICSKGHSWQAAIYSRNAGKGCPYCNHKYVLAGFNDLTTLAPQLIAEWDYEKNELLRPESFMSTSHKSVWWKCKRGHSWKTQIANRRNGCGCPYCVGVLVIKGETDLMTLRPDLCGGWDYEKNEHLSPEQISLWSSKKIWWRCAKGHSFEAGVANRARGNSCPYCSGKRPIIGETDFRTLHPELISEWDFEKNGKLSPEHFTIGSHKKIWWRCKDGHSWRTGIFNRHYGSGCPICAQLADRHPVVIGKTDLATINPIISLEWDYERNGTLTPQDVLPYSTLAVWWKCRRGHHWKTKIQTRAKGTGCPYCHGKVPMRTRLVK